MKFILTLATGYFLPTFLNTIAQHPGALDMLIGVLFGLLAGLLVAAVVLRPAPTIPARVSNRYPSKPSKVTKRYPSKQRSEFVPTNYEWSVA